MKDQEIKNLILTGEGYHIEFKESLNSTLVEEACAFANSSGGDILMGVADDNTIKGIDTSNRFRSRVQDILNTLQPKLDISVEVKENLIAIHVPEGKEKPYECPKGFFMRVGANSQKMTRDEVIQCFKKEGRVHFEELINEKSDFEKDFDPQAFKNFLKLSGISQSIAQEALLKNLDCLADNNKLTNLGVLFFAKDLDFIMNHALVDCILFKGTDKVKVLDRKQYKGNIIENINNALAFVQRHTNTEYVITGNPRREEIPDYPEVALREAIVNAVCHRDYFEKRGHVVVDVFSDRVEIYNPGGLPSGLDKKTFGTKSVPRNFLIASMLHRANYIEKAGTGINRIKQAIKNHKNKVTLDIKYGNNSMFYNVIFKKQERIGNKMSTPNRCVIWGDFLDPNLSYPSQKDEPTGRDFMPPWSNKHYSGLKTLKKQITDGHYHPCIYYNDNNNSILPEYIIYNPWAGGYYKLSEGLCKTGGIETSNNDTAMFPLTEDDTNTLRLSKEEKIYLSGYIAQENLKGHIPSLDKIMENQTKMKKTQKDTERRALLLLKGLVTLYSKEGEWVDLFFSQVKDLGDYMRNNPAPFLWALSYCHNWKEFRFLLFDYLEKEELIQLSNKNPRSSSSLPHPSLIAVSVQITPKGFDKIQKEKNKNHLSLFIKKYLPVLTFITTLSNILTGCWRS